MSPPPGAGGGDRLALEGRRIVLVQQALELGGAERQGILFARHLKEVHRAEVSMWGFDKPGLVTTLCEEAGIPWKVVPCPLPLSRFGRIRNIFRFARALRRAGVEILLPYTMPPNVVCGIGWRWSGARVCIWNQQDEGRQRPGPFWEQRATRNLRCFVSNSTAGADFLRDELKVPAERIRIIGNGIAIPERRDERDAWRGQLGIDAATPVACMVANLHSGKDHETLLHAWARVMAGSPGDRPQPVLLLAGRPEGTEDALAALAADLRLGDRVRFMGTVRDVGGLLSAVDLLVHSSVREGCPNAVQEAMALGLPVVGTDIPGMRDALGSGGVPLLASPGDSDGLAKRIHGLFAAPDRMASVGKENLARIRSECDPARVYGEMVELIGRQW